LQVRGLEEDLQTQVMRVAGAAELEDFVLQQVYP
jgi:hypothetical protein